MRVALAWRLHSVKMRPGTLNAREVLRRNPHGLAYPRAHPSNIRQIFRYSGNAVGRRCGIFIGNYCATFPYSHAADILVDSPASFATCKTKGHRWVPFFVLTEMGSLCIDHRDAGCSGRASPKTEKQTSRPSAGIFLPTIFCSGTQKIEVASLPTVSMMSPGDTPILKLLNVPLT